MDWLESTIKELQAKVRADPDRAPELLLEALCHVRYGDNFTANTPNNVAIVRGVFKAIKRRK